MPEGLYVDQPESVVVHRTPDAPLASDQVRIRTSIAAIKHGTEFHLFSGHSPFENRNFDRSLRLFVPRDSGSTRSATGKFVGNMIAGTVVETGSQVKKFTGGERVFCYGSACDFFNASEAAVEILLPPMCDADALCLDPALFAYGAVRDALVCVGDNVAVFGLGAIGLFVVQLLKLGGCMNIVGIDPISSRRSRAEKFGATVTLNPLECDVGMKSREILGAGADIAIEASGSYPALAQALRSVRQCGRIVTLGYYRGNGAPLELSTEWLHNRLTMISSLPDWNNPSREFPVWDKSRMWNTLIELFRTKRLVSEGILDPIVTLNDAPQTFLGIYRNTIQSVKMGIRF